MLHRQLQTIQPSILFTSSYTYVSIFSRLFFLFYLKIDTRLCKLIIASLFALSAYILFLTIKNEEEEKNAVFNVKVFKPRHLFKP